MYNDRADCTERPARPAYNDRPARTERPAYNSDRPARPAYDRTERPAYNDRPARTERPAYNSDRPARPAYDRAERTERPARPSYDRSDRPARPSYDRADRPARTERPSYDRAERAPRRDFDERPVRRESSYYPDRDAKSSFQPQEDVVLERLEAAVITAGEVEGVTFGDLGLGNNIVRQLASTSRGALRQIQAATIPDVLAGKDVLGRGRPLAPARPSPSVRRLSSASWRNNGGKDRQWAASSRALILAPPASSLSRSTAPCSPSRAASAYSPRPSSVACPSTSRSRLCSAALTS